MCGLLAFVTVNIGWLAGGLAQPTAYSVANDDISDLGADTAGSSWIYNRIGANLTGLLVVALALGLWRALSPDVLGRLGAGVLLVAGAGAVLDGFLPPRLPRDRHRLYQRLVALPRAQARVRRHRRRDDRGAADPRARVPTDPGMAGLVAAEPDHGARDPPGQCRLLVAWERSSHACGNGRRLPLDRLDRHAPPSARGPISDDLSGRRHLSAMEVLCERQAFCSSRDNSQKWLAEQAAR